MLLPGSITLEYHDEDWSQTIDYEHIPFRCRKCHEHGHLFREFPLNTAHREGNPENDKDKEGFVQPAGRRHQGNKKQASQVSKDPSTSNKFSILQDQPENPITPVNPHVPSLHNEPQTEGQSIEPPPQSKASAPPSLGLAREKPDLQEIEDGDEEMELEEKYLAGVDLDHLEHAYRHQNLYTIPRDQLRKVHKVFLNSSTGSSA